VSEDPTVDPVAAALVAETLVRLAVSFVVTPESVVAFDEPDAARRALRALVTPLLATATPPR